MTFSSVSWVDELSKLVASAKTDEERAALAAFQQAIQPYLENPGMLRTLLGKIASFVGEVGVLPADDFKNFEELKKAISKDIDVIKL